MIDVLKELNQHLEIESVHTNSFLPFGRVLNDFPFNEMAERMDKTVIPEEGNQYLPSIRELEEEALKGFVENRYFGGMPVQIGYCNGNNSSLGGLEFHKGSEINVAITDFVLLLGHTNDIVDNQYDVTNIKAFFVPKGTAIEMYQTTLHLAPCKVGDEGFKCTVILPEGTNTPLTEEQKEVDPLLFMKNKWLLAHTEHQRFMEMGAHKGIIGENITLAYPSKEQRRKLNV
ncbi:DUF4867 family protein [Guptibacillus algicola]|uniref:DUF4867 family protein n=1 Tax=Guptibacillus algicola TaxID=225844 RepID=UPI001CD5153F|nr:DUF4867 family protein [Alkalihalobacillus algicola]MCA0986603.1 DUF4867 family protein [Alkalihalobacillus algicola]